MGKYQETFDESIKNPEAFWGAVAEKTAWFKKPEKTFNLLETGQAQWFPGATLNTSYLCLDQHVEAGNGDRQAIIYESPVTNTTTIYTYSQLRDEVARFAGALKSKGITKGDRVIIYMPMVPQALIAMLACARLGAIHSVVFGGFAARELAIRIDDAGAKAVITADYGIEIERVIPYHGLVEEAIKESEVKPEFVISYNRNQKDVYHSPSFEDFETLSAVAEPADYVEVESEHPLYILYTSGTTGKPKGVVRDNGGHAVALRYSMEAIYNMKPGEVFWAASDIGWVVGHSYIVYAPLLFGGTTLVYEGKPIKTPDAGSFWRLIKKHHVKAFFTAPTAFRAIRKEDPNNEFFDPSYTESLRAVYVAGERCDVATLEWIKDLVKKPVIDHWWQTESGWAMLANMQGVEPLPVKPGSATKPVSGYNIQILREDGSQAGTNEPGLVAIKLPLPPGCFPTLWQNPERFFNGYLKKFPGYYFTGDGGYVDEDGYVFITGRVDDIINVAGHRLSTAEMEELTASLPCTAECAVVGAADELKGEIPVAFVVVKNTETRSQEELKKVIINEIRNDIGAVASLKTVYFVPRLPKTRSGKILRGILRNILNNEPFTVPGTIEDASVLDEIREITGHQ